MSCEHTRCVKWSAGNNWYVVILWRGMVIADDHFTSYYTDCDGEATHVWGYACHVNSNDTRNGLCMSRVKWSAGNNLNIVIWKMALLLDHLRRTVCTDACCVPKHVCHTMCSVARCGKHFKRSDFKKEWLYHYIVLLYVHALLKKNGIGWHILCDIIICASNSAWRTKNIGAWCALNDNDHAIHDLPWQLYWLWQIYFIRSCHVMTYNST